MKIKMDYRRLRGKIREIYGTEGAFAKALGISAVSLSGKLNNGVQFTQDEMNKSCELLEIPLDHLPVYFFTQEVKEAKL